MPSLLPLQSGAAPYIAPCVAKASAVFGVGLKLQRKGLCVLHSRVVETLLTKLLTIQFEFWMHRISYASKCSIALYLPAGRMISLSCQHSMSARLSQLCAGVASCVALRQSPAPRRCARASQLCAPVAS